MLKFVDKIGFFLYNINIMNGRKIKVYLDTSVVSHLWQLDALEKMQETLALWEEFKKNKFDIYLSDLTIDESNECSEEKRNKLFNYLKQIKYTRLSITSVSADIASQIINLGILKEKSRDDANHIGIAVANELDYIVSWNFKHMVNIKTVNGVRAITNLRGYKDIDLVTPTYFLGEE